jgi:hypothetical protein
MRVEGGQHRGEPAGRTDLQCPLDEASVATMQALEDPERDHARSETPRNIADAMA